LIRDLAAPGCGLLRRRLFANASLAGVLLLGAVLLLYPPAPGRFYPVCPVRRYFGIDCPGCGATRALAVLLHGHLLEAVQLNALFVVLLPGALAVAMESYRRAMRPGTFHWPQLHAGAVYAMLAAAVGFTVARNLIR